MARLLPDASSSPPKPLVLPYERLAGVYVAKEAAFKALSLPKGDWQILEIRHDADGRPSVILSLSAECWNR